MISCGARGKVFCVPGRIGVCPFIEKADVRCGEYLSFRNVARAFTYCADCYASCPIYRKLIARRHANDRRQSAARLLAS